MARIIKQLLKDFWWWFWAGRNDSKRLRILYDETLRELYKKDK